MYKNILLNNESGKSNAPMAQIISVKSIPKRIDPVVNVDMVNVDVKNINKINRNELSNNVNEWLNSKINDMNANSTYDEPNIGNMYAGNRNASDYELYYTANDTDMLNSESDNMNMIEYLKNHDIDELNNDYELSIMDNVMETYGNKKILIAPSSNRYHANYLFKDLIRCSKNMTYSLPSINNESKGTNHWCAGEMVSVKLFTPEMKNYFYNFLYDNSNK
jgi:hypothetical protein